MWEFVWEFANGHNIGLEKKELSGNNKYNTHKVTKILLRIRFVYVHAICDVIQQPQKDFYKTKTQAAKTWTQNNTTLNQHTTVHS